MERLFTIGSKWETVSDRDRVFLKGFIGRIVGYPCKIACKFDGEVVDVYVMSERTGNVEDWIEVHENGSICPNEELYRKRVKGSVMEACDAHNSEYDVEPYSDESDNEEDEGSKEDEESQERDNEGDSEEEDEEDDDSSDEQSV
jgi:hypothetical protein